MLSPFQTSGRLFIELDHLRTSFFVRTHCSTSLFGSWGDAGRPVAAFSCPPRAFPVRPRLRPPIWGRRGRGGLTPPRPFGLLYVSGALAGGPSTSFRYSNRFPTIPATTAFIWSMVSMSRDVVAAAEFVDVPLEVLRTHPVVRSHVGSLQDRPQRLHAVRVDVAPERTRHGCGTRTRGCRGAGRRWTRPCTPSRPGR